ncbi:hypothetical protein VKT23_007964 [Stygiomarasmius scandens]|uniref:Uncharacterized protein n=1 Tax=Marasmiellus scandens TaxID=2682957 RepID=A0ABR1JIW5_9AGAR
MTSSDAFFKSWKETVPSTSATDTRKKHDTLKRHFVVAFTSIAAAVLLLILTSRRNTECNEFFREDEHFASDPRLDKYQSPSDASFCHDLTGNLDQEALFSLSPESSFTFFLSRASSIIGSFHIRESTDSSDDTIRVNITGAEDVSKTPYSYARRNLESEMVTACYAERDGEQGIILWVGKSWINCLQFCHNLFRRLIRRELNYLKISSLELPSLYRWEEAFEIYLLISQIVSLTMSSVQRLSTAL